jgi:hypothetical protein
MDGWMWVIYKGGLVEWRGPMGVVDNYTWDMENEIGLGLVSEVSEDTLYLDVSVYQFFLKEFTKFVERKLSKLLLECCSVELRLL